MAHASPRSNLLIPLLVAAAFLGPLLLAIVLYYTGGERFIPASTTAHGQLIEQPRTLPEAPVAAADGAAVEFRGLWSLVYVGSGECGDDCRLALYHTRQVRRALGKEMSRVQRIYVATEGMPDPGFIAGEQSGLHVIGSSAPAYTEVVTALGSWQEGDVFVADPFGNVMLRFPAGTSMKDMHADLHHLLKASQIG